MALGPVVFAQSNRAKRISISVRPFSPIRLAFPRRISIKKAKKFLHENLDWAGKSLKKAREAEERHKTALKSRIGGQTWLYIQPSLHQEPEDEMGQLLGPEQYQLEY